MVMMSFPMCRFLSSWRLKNRALPLVGPGRPSVPTGRLSAGRARHPHLLFVVGRVRQQGRHVEHELVVLESRVQGVGSGGVSCRGGGSVAHWRHALVSLLERQLSLTAKTTASCGSVAAFFLLQHFSTKCNCDLKNRLMNAQTPLGRI